MILAGCLMPLVWLATFRDGHRIQGQGRRRRQQGTGTRTYVNRAACIREVLDLLRGHPAVDQVWTQFGNVLAQGAIVGLADVQVTHIYHHLLTLEPHERYMYNLWMQELGENMVGKLFRFEVRRALLLQEPLFLRNDTARRSRGFLVALEHGMPARLAERIGELPQWLARR